MASIKKKLKNRLKFLLNQLPYVRTLNALNANSRFPAGHFYSSVVSLREIREREDEIWPKEVEKSVPGIDINEEGQLKLLKELSGYYSEMPLPVNKVEGRHYFLDNDYYAYNDGIILYSFLRYFKPKKIIEIGSGVSSGLMLDVNRQFFKGEIELIFIEPFPEVRLNRLLKKNNSVRVRSIEKKVQHVDLAEFLELGCGDILFIDSSHVVKTGSDLNFILFEILPVLKRGVLIHFHDIHFPFEYPKSWVLDGIGWNESYFIRSFLTYNSKFQILLFSDYLHKKHPKAFDEMPLTRKAGGSSFWIEKCA